MPLPVSLMEKKYLNSIQMWKNIIYGFGGGILQ